MAAESGRSRPPRTARRSSSPWESIRDDRPVHFARRGQRRPGEGVVEEDIVAKILMLVSSAKVIRLADGTPHTTGYFVEEAIKPYDRFVAAGVDVVVATADGQTPHPDPYGLEHFFHYPDEDEDFLASVTRTFMHDVDDIRVTLRHLTEIDLIAARRVHRALCRAGASNTEARVPIDRAARIAWSRGDNFIDLLSGDEQVTARVTPARLRELADEVKRES